MTRRFTPSLLAVLLWLPLSASAAQEDDPIRDQLEADLKRGGLSVQSVQDGPAPGVYEVVANDRVYFILASHDGATYYLTDGLRDLRTGADLGDSTRRSIRREILADIGEKRMLVYGSKTAKHTITVFTDPTCGYCQRLHRQMAEYNAAGIRVRYLLYPRAGQGSDAYETLVSIWCSDDPSSAMDRAKAQLSVEKNLCANHPVDAHMAAGRRFGINGTPAIVTESGELIPGYVPPQRLRQELDRLAAQ